MKTQLHLENSVAICHEFYRAETAAQKREIGLQLINNLVSGNQLKKGTIETTLSPVIQLHVDTFERTGIKLKPNNLLNIVEGFIEKEKMC